MKKTEIVKLLKFLNSFYQKKFDYPKENKQDTQMMIETWYLFLAEFDYKIVKTVVKKIVIEKEWPPTPGDLVKETKKAMLSDEDEISGPEAWDMIIAAIKKHSALYNPEKVLESVPQRVAKAAQVTGLQTIAKNSESDTFIMNRFIKTYKQIKERDMEREMLPGDIRKDYEKIKSKNKAKKLASKFKNVAALKGEIENS